MSFQLLPCIISDEKFVFIFIFDPLYVMSFFFLLLLRFSFPHWLSAVWLWHALVCVFLVHVFVLEVWWEFWICGFIVFIRFFKILIITFDSVFSLLLWDSSYTHVRSFMLFQSSARLSAFFSLFCHLCLTLESYHFHFSKFTNLFFYGI